MQKYKILDGVLGALPVFESAARHLNFTKAAEELRLTQPAISRRIATIEELLGIEVFKRNHNKLELTSQGKEILVAVELGLGHLNRVISQIATYDKKKKLTVACGISFGTLWLQHRILEFKQLLDELEVQIIVSELPENLDPDKVDIRILWNDNFWPDRHVHPLFGEGVTPVCSPSFRERHLLSKYDYSSIDLLSKNILLQDNGKGSGFLDWAGWFRVHGFDYMPSEKDYFFDNYQFVIQAALDGLGVALGFSVLIDDLLKSKELVQIGPTVHYRDQAFFIEFASNRISEEIIQKVNNWFRLQIDTR
jgi:LysR family transcriptional regulator, glycine cleavage system transcriptional activator